jgi:alkylation response protein AidB-like acyl-CoA dehydrogenase
MATTAEPTSVAYRGPYDLTEDQELFKRSIHEFVEREIVPIAHDLDEREQYPRETIAQMGELGLLGMLVPEEYGGAG